MARHLDDSRVNRSSGGRAQPRTKGEGGQRSAGTLYYTVYNTLGDLRHTPIQLEDSRTDDRRYGDAMSGVRWGVASINETPFVLYDHRDGLLSSVSEEESPREKQ